MGLLVAIVLLWVVIGSAILLIDHDADRRREDREIRAAIRARRQRDRALRSPRVGA